MLQLCISLRMSLLLFLFYFLLFLFYFSFSVDFIIPRGAICGSILGLTISPEPDEYPTHPKRKIG